jgi:hypothetical protein
MEKKEENSGTETGLDAILNSALVDIKQAKEDSSDKEYYTKDEVTELLTKVLKYAVKSCYNATKLYADKSDSVVLLKAENYTLSKEEELLKEIVFLRQDLNELHRKIK